MKSLLHTSLRRVEANFETLLALANFGASSLYWLVLAFILPAAIYGKIMTLQAAVMLVIAIVAPRTHDLVFYLIASKAHDLQAAYRKALIVETSILFLSSTGCVLGAVYYFDRTGQSASIGMVGGLVLLSALANVQGASTAKLRYEERGHTIARVDSVTLSCWLFALASLLAVHRLGAEAMLLIGTAPYALRTILMNLLAMRYRSAKLQSTAVPAAARAIANFLFNAQLTNVFKNGALPLETMILAAFCPPAIVAQYRLAKSTQGIANAAINVEYQRSYAALSQADSVEQRRNLVAKLGRRSMLLCLFAAPLSILVALAYGLAKAQVDVVTFELVTLGAFLAFLPTALQQGPVIMLLLKGMHRPVNAAYAISTGVLFGTSGLLFLSPSIFTFLFATFAASIARWYYLSAKARPLLAIGTDRGTSLFASPPICQGTSDTNAPSDAISGNHHSMSSSTATRSPRKTIGWFIGSQASAWLAFHQELLHGFWYRLLVRSKGGRFTQLYNFRAAMKRVDVRTRFDETSKRAHVSSRNFDIEVYPQQRALNFARGIEQRAKKLGTDYLLENIEFDEGDIVIDCGANTGDFKLCFQHAGVNVRYIGIEPGPREYQVMQKNTAPSETYNVGLWNEDGEMTFYVSSKGADSSLIEPPAYDSIIKVATRRLDRLVDFPRIKLLKIEAEGAEPEALEGASGLLDRIEYITADLGGERGLDQASTLAPVTNFLLSHGFELIAVNHQRIVALYRNRSLHGAD